MNLNYLSKLIEWNETTIYIKTNKSKQKKNCAQNKQRTAAEDAKMR